ncbi:MAG: efflux RND transporter permease subunit [Calditrichia bacterium]
MFLSDISIKRPIMMSMFLVVFLLFGSIAYFGMPLNLFPTLDIPFITIQTVYPGAGPKEIESEITKKIEDAVSSVSKIKTITSYSMESVSLVMIEFELGKDVDIANQEVKDKVDAIINEFPDDAEQPLIQKLNLQEEPIVDLILSGEIPMTELYDLADKRLKDRLSQIEGVARVDLRGGQKREIQVVLDNRTIFSNRLNLAQLTQILAAQNVEMPAGTFKKRSQELSVKTDAKFKTLEELANQEIPAAGGVKKLGELADIRDANEEVRERTTYFNNQTGVSNDRVMMLSLVKSPSGNTVEIARQVRELLPTINEELPAGVRLSLVNDSSVFIQSSVEDTLSNIFLGILFTGLVLLFFLHDVRSTIIVALAMPMSMISAFLFMQVSGFSLNIMSLTGLSTSVGVLVTNSVVVLENIFRHKQMGTNRKEAAAKGTAEIAVAVLASTMTNIAVFLPIAQMQSIVGQFFQEFALTVTYATIFSLIISFTLTPMLASLILPEGNGKKHKIGDRLEALFTSWEKAYGRLLNWVLKSKKRGLAVVAIAIISFLISLPVGGQVGFEFAPMMDEGDINIEVELPQGYNLEQTAQTVKTIESRLKQHKEILQSSTTLGRISDTDVGTNLAILKVKLVDASEREIKTTEMANQLIREMSDIPNAMIRIAAISSMDNGGQSPITFQLLGQDMNILEELKNQLEPKLKEVHGLVNLNTSSRSGKPEIAIIPDRKKLARAGLTAYDLAINLRVGMTGLVTTKYKEDGEEYDIRVMLEDASVDDPEKIGNIAIVGPNGRYTINQVAEVKQVTGYNKILHYNKYKSIRFTGSTSPDVPLGTVVEAINQKVAELNLPSGYKIEWAGDAKMMQETMVDMLRTFAIALILTYMLLAAILESLTQPLLILGTVPLALIGVFFGLFLTGKTMNMVSMMAIIMLLGIVVNNAILLLDYTNELRRKGKKITEALLEACPTKLKPIIMSSIAIILGMLPMALGLGSAGREVREPMGIVAIGGLIVSTVLSLLVIPVLYNLTMRESGRN